MGLLSIEVRCNSKAYDWTGSDGIIIRSQIQDIVIGDSDGIIIRVQLQDIVTGGSDGIFNNSLIP